MCASTVTSARFCQRAMSGAGAVQSPLAADSILSHLDQALHCSICADFYDTPLVLHCGHSCKQECLVTQITQQEPRCAAGMQNSGLLSKASLVLLDTPYASAASALLWVQAVQAISPV